MEEENQFDSLSNINSGRRLPPKKGSTTKLCLTTFGVMLAVFLFLGLIKKILLLQELNTEYLKKINTLETISGKSDGDVRTATKDFQNLSDQSINQQLQNQVQYISELQRSNQQLEQSQKALKEKILQLQMSLQSCSRCRQEIGKYTSTDWVKSPDDVLQLIAEIDQKRSNQNKFWKLFNSTLIKFGADEHFYDSKLYELLTIYYEKKSIRTIVDFGCGKCEYLSKLHDQKGYETQGFDGSPYSNDSLVRQADLSQPINLGITYDYVQSFEVGQHIFSNFEDNFMENIVRHARLGIVMSWAIVGQKGYMHVNNRNNQYVIQKIEKLGFAYNIQDTTWFRSRLNSHFSSTIMVFTKKY